MVDEIIERFINTIPIDDKRSLSESLNDIQNLSGRRFRLAVVNPKSNGNINIVEGLLGRKLMRKAVRKKLKFPLKIVYNELMRITLVADKKSHIYKSVDLNKIEQIILNHENYESLTIEFPNENLRLSGIELYDIPGIEKNNELTQQIDTVKIIANADKIILAIDHNSLLGQEDISQLEWLSKTYQISDVIVIINGFEKINTEEQEVVLKYLKNKLSNVGISCKLMVETTNKALSINAERLVSFKGYTDLWKNILAELTDKNLYKRRAISQYFQLKHLIQNYQENLVQNINSAKIDIEKQNKNISETRNKNHSLEVDWRILENDLRKIMGDQIDWMKKEVSLHTIKIKEVAAYGLKRTKDLRGWFEVELPHDVQNEVSTMHNNLSASLIDRLKMDFIQIEKKIQNTFSYKVELNQQKEFFTVYNRFSEISVDKNLLKDYKHFASIMITLASVISIPIFGPLAAAIGASGGLFKEIYNKKKVKNQKEQLEVLVNRSIDRHMLQITHELKNEFTSLYENLSKEIKSKAKIWKELQENNIKELKNLSTTKIEQLQSRKNEIEEILSEFESIC